MTSKNAFAPEDLVDLATMDGAARTAYITSLYEAVMAQHATRHGECEDGSDCATDLIQLHQLEMDDSPVILFLAFKSVTGVMFSDFMEDGTKRLVAVCEDIDFYAEMHALKDIKHLGQAVDALVTHWTRQCAIEKLKDKVVDSPKSRASLDELLDFLSGILGGA